MKQEIFEFYKGTTYSRDFTLSGWSLFVNDVYFIVKEDENNKNAVLQKKLGDGITLVNDEGGVKVFNLLIDAEDTDNLKAEVDYPFAVKIINTEANKPIKEVLFEGVLRLINHSASTHNEYKKEV